MLKQKRLNKFSEFIPLLIWMAIFILPFIIRVVNMLNEHSEPVPNNFYNAKVLIGLFCLHTYLIYPVREKKYGLWYYGLLILTCLLGYFVLQIYFGSDISLEARQAGLWYPIRNLHPVRLRSIFPFALIIFISYYYSRYMDTIRQNNLLKELETVHLKTELDFLRSQISPHFMFNIMNTLVSMARKKPELMESSLISLSQLMRYMLYDSDGSQISLEKEIEYLKNYINLQLLRFGDDVHFNLFLSGNFEGFKIEPMLLIPFVENAFKHGIGTIKNPLIDVSIDIDGNKRLFNMVVMNNIVEKISINDKGSGIGLNNVQRRLELLYPDKHTITINQKEHLFTVNLEISL
jgi:two-component system LytT family sensor kinase